MKNVRLLLGICCALIGSLAQAQSYPTKPIRIVVPFAAGGSGDVVARLIGAGLTEAWGQQIVVDNRPGAAGAIGANVVARAEPDGHTLLLASSLAITPHLQKSNTFDIQKDLAPIVPVSQIEFALTVHPSLPASNLAEFVALMKANPGKYNYASAGVGSIHHLSMEWFKRLAGIDIVHVPYKGSGQIMPDVISGKVEVTYVGLAQAAPFAKDNKVKVIAIGGPQRIAAAPNVAPIAESYPGFNGTTSWDLLAPAGTAPEIVRKLNAEVNRILRQPALEERLVSLGLFPLGGSPEQFAARIRADYERWGRLIGELGVKPE
jgi:tripartite-type tricarboxylate transporter receptor subunit TctC